MDRAYYCFTCLQHRDNVPYGQGIYPSSISWCIKYEKRIPWEFCNEHSICCHYKHIDPCATEFDSNIRLFPEGELWSFTLYLPCRKLANIADLPKVDVLTGEVIE